jgi:CRP-like cAMP-binding protein
MSEVAEQRIEDVARSLTGITLLQRLPPHEKRNLEAQCRFRSFASGAVILDRFSASAGVFFLVAGTARVIHYIADQEEITIATIAAGDTIGDISAIDGLGRSATVVADSNCLAAELPRPEFHALLSRCGDVALDLLRRWAGTIRQLSDKVSFLSTGTPDQRVYSELMRLARPEDKPNSERWLIRDLPSHQDLARWAQTSREIVAGAVAELLRRGVAERRMRTLYISDYAMLRTMTLGAPAEPNRGGNP